MSQNLELNFYTGDGEGFAENAKTLAKTIAKSKTKLTNADTDLNSVDNINVESFFATQKDFATTSNADNFTWAYDGSDGGHSFSWYENDINKAYAIATGQENSYGQKLFTVNSTGKPEERAGNLYNYSMATAGSGMSIISGNASDSICPKGWILPKRDNEYSFHNLGMIYNGGTMPVTGLTHVNPATELFVPGIASL